VRIGALELEALEPARLAFRVTCSKGTYVRTLGEDLARALGTCGHLAALERTAVGAFAAHTAHPLAALESLAGREAELDALLLPLDAALGALPAVALGPREADRFRHGQALAPGAGLPAGTADGTPLRVYAEPGRFLGLARAEAGLLRPLRLLANPPAGSPDAPTS
jgi:tRNA pseudouridine55 synthase